MLPVDKISNDYKSNKIINLEIQNKNQMKLSKIKDEM